MLFKSKKAKALPAGDIPRGTFFQTEAGYFFVESTTKRYRLTSDRALASWAPARVVQASESDAAVQAMRIVARLKFRNGSLIWNLSDGRLYLIESGKRRWVKSPDALTRIGATKDEALVVSEEEVELHAEGEDLI